MDEVIISRYLINNILNLIKIFKSTPRVNSRLLSNYVGKNVILIAETGQGTGEKN